MDMWVLQAGNQVTWKSKCIYKHWHRTGKFKKFVPRLVRTRIESSCLSLHSVDNFSSLVQVIPFFILYLHSFLKANPLKRPHEPWPVLLSWLECCRVLQKVACVIPSQGTCLSCGLNPYSGHAWGNQSMFSPHINISLKTRWLDLGPISFKQRWASDPYKKK